MFRPFGADMRTKSTSRRTDGRLGSSSITLLYCTPLFFLRRPMGIRETGSDLVFMLRKGSSCDLRVLVMLGDIVGWC